MMFASDLDRTIIYSNRALQDFPTDLELTPVEKKSGEFISFMTKASLQALQRISSKVLFVPVTTRSLAQFQRVFLNNIDSKYAVTSNGATILYKGEILSEWTDKVKKEIANESAHIEEVSTFVNKHFAIVGRVRHVENLFFYYTLTDHLSASYLGEMEEVMLEKGWRMSYQGKKLYFMPEPLSKGNAVTYIQEREGIATLLGAGDSRLDDDFLKLCHHAYVLGHGELAKMPLQEHYKIVPKVGAQGGEELLKTVLAIVDKS